MKPLQLVVLSVILLMAIAWGTSAHADKFIDTIDIYKKSPSVKPFFENSYGYVVFPTVGGQKFSFEPNE